MEIGPITLIQADWDPGEITESAKLSPIAADPTTVPDHLAALHAAA